MLQFFKDPDSTLDYLFDWTDWLDTTETITAQEVTVDDSGLVIDSYSENSGIVTAWLSAGVAGTVYKLSCKITTDASRICQRTMTIRVQER